VIAAKLREERAKRPATLRDNRHTGILVHPVTIDPGLVERLGRSALLRLEQPGIIEDGQYSSLLGVGLIDFRIKPGNTIDRLQREMGRWQNDYIGSGLGHPDIWPGVVVGDLDDLPGILRSQCQRQPGGIARYSYEELRQYADLLQDRLRQSPKVGKIDQMGVVDEAIYLFMSGHRSGATNLDLQSLGRLLAQRNIDTPGGTFELPAQRVNVKPTGKLARLDEIRDMVVNQGDGYPIYLRDHVEIVRGYQDPPRSLNFRTIKAPAGDSPTRLPDGLAGLPEPVVTQTGTGSGGPTELWTTRAITLAVRHVEGTQIADFSRDVDAAIASLKGVLPADLRLERTSDEPERVRLKIREFNDCLLEAIVIVVAVALVFMEWRSALIVALSIPITLAMTLGFCSLIGIDLQQISIAALIIALGLLVDDPVVAGDAINRELALGEKRDVAAWLGPQKLSRAILYATITNCVAFLPLLMVSGVVGEFIYSLPVVVTASLVASRIVSMTFIPLLGYYLLKGQAGMEASLAEGGGRGSRFARVYNGFSEICMRHKWISLAACLIFLATAMSLIPMIGTNFFPKDLHSAFTIDLFLPEGASIAQTREQAMRAIAETDSILGAEVEAYTTFVGAGGPRFWISIVPEQPASNYAQILVHTTDRHRTIALADRLKRELPSRIAEARVRVNQLESGPPIGIPVQLRIMGPDIATLRRLAEESKALMRDFPGTTDISDDWEPEVLQLGLQVDPQKASLSGVTNQAVAELMNAALSGSPATWIRERDRLIPVTFKLRPDERSRFDALRTLKVPTHYEGQRVPLDQVARFSPEAVAPKIARRDHERCITVKCDTVPGVLPSKAVEFLDARLKTLSKSWPAGFHYGFGGEKEEQEKGFASMGIAMVTSILAIYLALVLQFNSLMKPMVIFAAVPFGMVGGLMGLLVSNTPLGFFALLGLSSLAGVIISHVIVLFEYIEEANERGESLRRAVIDAALVRLRPVLVTVLATVGGLIPLAIKGGPLWEPLCYVQIVGLLLATLVTKVVVPVLYVIFVEDLGWIRWGQPGQVADQMSSEPVVVP
jgi:multidrug efflux pump subunit AcrB